MGVVRQPVPALPAAGPKVHFAGLDGVRALAVAGVLLYHAGLPWMQGGFLGVDVFFVLSGFLITSLLVREIQSTGGLSASDFYLRRARRLLPALVLLLVAVAIGAVFFVPDAAPRLRGDGLASLFYVSNWWLVYRQDSYFEFIGRAPLLQHLWSLAIEEQFYLVWPLAVLACIRVLGRRGFGAVSLMLAVASTVWMAQLAAALGYPDADPSRIYFGTDTHCMGLLLGAALASVWRPWHSYRRLSMGDDVALGAVGLAALAGILALFATIGERDPLLYRGGFLAIAAVVCVLVVAASHPESSFGRLLGLQPLRWVGERSYGLYLWHWPVFLVTRPEIDVTVSGPQDLALRLMLTAAAAELSYRLVESPIRHGAIERFVRTWRTSGNEQRRTLAWRGAVVAVPALLVSLAAVVALAFTAGDSGRGSMAPDVAEAMGLSNGGPTRVTIERLGASDTPPAVSTGGAAEGPPAAPPKARPARLAKAAAAADDGLTAIGDSVLLGARMQLERSIRGAQTDAEVGRQAAAVVTRVHELHSENLLAPTVLVHLGTNGHITKAQLRRALTELSDRQRVLVMNARAPKQWVRDNNEMIAKVVPEYRNAILIDWAELSTGHPEFFASDGVHLSSVGQRALVTEVIRAGGFPAPPERGFRPPRAAGGQVAPTPAAAPPPLHGEAVDRTDADASGGAASIEGAGEDHADVPDTSGSAAGDPPVPAHVPDAPASDVPAESEPTRVAFPHTGI